MLCCKNKQKQNLKPSSYQKKTSALQILCTPERAYCLFSLNNICVKYIFLHPHKHSQQLLHTMYFNKSSTSSLVMVARVKITFHTRTVFSSTVLHFWLWSLSTVGSKFWLGGRCGELFSCEIIFNLFCKRCIPHILPSSSQRSINAAWLFVIICLHFTRQTFSYEIETLQ